MRRRRGPTLANGHGGEAPRESVDFRPQAASTASTASGTDARSGSRGVRSSASAATAPTATLIAPIVQARCSRRSAPPAKPRRWPRSALRRVAAIVPSAARPIAPNDLQRHVDDARGEAGVARRHVGHRRSSSAAGTRCRRRGRAAGTATNRPREVGSRRRRLRESSSSASDDQPEAGEQRPQRAEAPHQRGCGAPSDMRADRRASCGRNASPVCDRAVAEHALEVERAEEEGREHPGDQQAAHEARAHQLRRRRMRSGMIGLRDPRLEHEEGARAARARAPPKPSVCAESPAVFGRLHDRVDAEHRRDGDQHRAEPVDAVAAGRCRSFSSISDAAEQRTRPRRSGR